MARKMENDYFAMLAEMVECSCHAAKKLQEVLMNFSQEDLPKLMEELHEIEHTGDKLKHSLSKKLVKEFITPIDREDIMGLAGEIDDVTDSVEDVLLKVYMFNISHIRPDALEFASVVQQCCDELLLVMREFSNYKKSQTIHNSIVELNRLEEVGDALYMKAVHDLYLERCDPLETIAWTEVYRRFELCCDTCEHAANLVENVIMKNS